MMNTRKQQIEMRNKHKEIMGKLIISKHTGKRMFERKIQKQWIASAILKGEKTIDKGSICCIHKGRKFVYKIKKDSFYIVTVMPYW